MMEHIRQFDWCATSGPTDYFVQEAELDNSNIEKILRNKFRDPLVSSDEDNEPNVIDWGPVFKNNNKKFVPKQFCPGLRPSPQYPKLSAMTSAQHYNCLKVLCAKYPQVYQQQHLPKPTGYDRRWFETLTDTYEAEKKEFIEWAKSQWESQHCIRALRPKPVIETVYEAEFKMKACRLGGYPKRFDMAAQIPIECSKEHMYEAVLDDTLIDVKLSDVPSIQLPELTKNVNIMNSDSVPEPCQKHPYPFILPNDHSVSVLPITEVHRELANFAAENNTKYIASENALRCLIAINRHWTIPVTVCSAFTPDGEAINVVVLDSEFSVHKEPAMTRTYRAYRHLLAHGLIPPSEMEKRIENYKKDRDERRQNVSGSNNKSLQITEPEFTSEDDDTMGLFIHEESNDDQEDTKSVGSTGDNKTSKEDKNKNLTEEQSAQPREFNRTMSLDDINDIIGVYNCSCVDTLFEVPPPRSFKKWRFTDRTRSDTHNIIIHCSHKAKEFSTEVLLEPIPEYQLELGGSQLTTDRARGLALSLMLRKKAAVLKVRVDASNGDVVMLEKIPCEEFLAQHDGEQQKLLNMIHTTLSELEGLMPGHYVLQHEPSHGSNAFLLVSRPSGDRLQLNFDATQLMEADEAKMVKEPPVITPVLMPFHKYRRILPCAFTPFESQLAKESKKPATKQKTPPQAIKWPKKRGKKKKKKNN